MTIKPQPIPVRSSPDIDPLAPRLLDRATFESIIGTPGDKADQFIQSTLAILESRAAALESAANLRLQAIAVQADSILLGVQEKLAALFQNAAAQVQELDAQLAAARGQSDPAHNPDHLRAQADAARAAIQADTRHAISQCAAATTELVARAQELRTWTTLAQMVEAKPSQAAKKPRTPRGHKSAPRPAKTSAKRTARSR